MTEISTNSYQLVRDREKRHIKPNPRYEINNLIDFILSTGETVEYPEPTSFQETMNDPKDGN